jgi:hypothetical protein
VRGSASLLRDASCCCCSSSSSSSSSDEAFVYFAMLAPPSPPTPLPPPRTKCSFIARRLVWHSVIGVRSARDSVWWTHIACCRRHQSPHCCPNGRRLAIVLWQDCSFSSSSCSAAAAAPGRPNCKLGIPTADPAEKSRGRFVPPHIERVGRLVPPHIPFHRHLTPGHLQCLGQI